MPRTIDWAEPSPDGGRFGRLKAGLAIACAVPACVSQWGTGEIHPEGPHTAIALLWQQPDGAIVHYRCAPEAERRRYVFQLRGVGIATAPDFHLLTGRCWHGVQHGIRGAWLFKGASYRTIDGVAIAEYAPILWRRARQQPLF